MTVWQPGAFDAVIFDLDDTLYPESAYVLSGFRAVARWADHTLGIPEAAGYAALASLFRAGVHGRTFNVWLAACGLDPEPLVPELIAVYRGHAPDIAPFADAPPLLALLRARGCRIGLLSDGYLAVQQRKFAALQLAAAFDAVVFSDAFGRENWKPAPVAYRAVAAQLGVDAARSLYVADNPAKDFVGARRVGMASVRVRRPDGLYARLQPDDADHAPDLTVQTLDELRPLIQTRDKSVLRP